MIKGATVAIGVVIALLLRAIFVPLLAAFFGATIGYVFYDTTTAFMEHIGFGDMAFWQLSLIVGALGMFWAMGAPTAVNNNANTKV